MVSTRKEQGRRLYEDQGQNHNQLSTPGLNSGTEGFITAAQDQCNKTNNYRKMVPTPLCRICGQSRETADRLFSPCPELAKTEYIQRHNTAATYLHWTIYASTMTSKKKINTKNMNQLQ